MPKTDVLKLAATLAMAEAERNLRALEDFRSNVEITLRHFNEEDSYGNMLELVSGIKRLKKMIGNLDKRVEAADAQEVKQS